jgi:hypothetical protein
MVNPDVESMPFRMKSLDKNKGVALCHIKITEKTLVQNWNSMITLKFNNGTARFKKCKQLFEYQHLLVLRDIRWSNFESISKCCSFFQQKS